MAKTLFELATNVLFISSDSDKLVERIPVECRRCYGARWALMYQNRIQVLMESIKNVRLTLVLRLASDYPLKNFANRVLMTVMFKLMGIQLLLAQIMLAISLDSANSEIPALLKDLRLAAEISRLSDELLSVIINLGPTSNLIEAATRAKAILETQAPDTLS